MSRRIQLLAIGVAFLLSQLTASAVVTPIYVSTNGAASGNGTTLSAPVNLARAQARVREINSTMTNDIHVLLLPGRYPLAATLAFTERDSGSNGFKVVWRAQDTNNPPLLSGGAFVTNWSLVAGTSNVWSAPVTTTAFRQLYVNGERRPRAKSRLPIDVKRVVQNANNNTRVVLVDSATLPPTLTAPGRAEIHVINDWRDYFVALAAAYPTNDARYEQPLTSLIASGSQWGDTGGAVAFAPGLDDGCYLENAPELLDEPGEWYANASSNRLYYIAKPGENMATAQVVIPLLQTLVRVSATSGQRVRNLEFDGLRFEHATWTSVNNTGFVPVQGSEFQRPFYGLFPGAVEVQRAEYFAFRNCRFAHVGATALYCIDRVADATIVGNAFTDVAGCGLHVGTKGLTPANGLPVRINVANNLFHRIGADYRGSVAFISYSLRDSAFTHNHIEDVPYTGVHVGDFNSNGGGYNNTNTFSESGNNLLGTNLVRNFVKFCRDGGGFYINGCQRGSDGITRPSLVTDNVIQEMWRDEGALYSEDHSANVTYQRNVCEQSLNIPLSGERRWLYAWSAASFNLYFGTNANANYATTNMPGYYNTGDQGVAGHGYVGPTRYNSPAVRPAGAAAIVVAAGLEPAYTNLLALLPNTNLNLAPIIAGLSNVTCGLNQTITLSATVSDDGLPFDRLVLAWSKASGPGDVTFSSLALPATRVAFSASGSYVLNFNVKDGALQTTVPVTVTVTPFNFGPSVVAGQLPDVSSTYFADWDPAWVTDGAFSTDYKDGIWLAAGGDAGGPYCQLDAGRPVVPSRFVIGARAGNADERSNFEIRASATPNFSSYVVLAEQGGDAYGNTARWAAHATTTNAFRYFRAQSGNANFSVSEFQIFESTQFVSAASAPATLISTGAVWRYFDKTNDLGAAWRSNNFSDATWSNGPAMLGFGAANGILPTTQIASNGEWTAYFRRIFLVPEPANITSLGARLLRDDGVVVYLNGVEVWRNNLPAGVITNSTPASSAISGADESTWLTRNLSRSPLLAGTNLLAVEIHQDIPISSDFTFNFELTTSVLIPDPPALKLTRKGESLAFTWPADPGLFAVFTAPNLTPPVIWARITNAPLFVNGQWTLDLPLTTNITRFYRLQTP